MKKEVKHIIKSVEPGSIAEELEIEPGDALISINDKKINDVFDYHYLCNDEYLTVVIEKPDGEEWELDIEKDYEEDLGIEFENGLMDEYRSCHNKCIFCFIDQMPPGMRETLYFKDDDSRLSFLQGNYVTLTNMSDEDVERIITYKMEPINVSVQTMNPKLRCMMLTNRFAGDALKKIDKFYEAGIIMNGQIVLCKGVNDGDELIYSLDRLLDYAPVMQSVSVVPVGLSKYRDGLYPLEPFNKEEAGEVIDIIEEYQKKAMKRYGIHFVQASDEWYLTAGRELPEEERYDGYLQLENGVGMLRLLTNEFAEALDLAKGSRREMKLFLATGKLVYPTIKSLAESIHEKFPNIRTRVLAIENHFFGELITVSGLITGKDLIEQVKPLIEPGEILLLPQNMLRMGEEVFLDDITLDEVKAALNVDVRIVGGKGKDLLSALTDETYENIER